MTASLDYSTFLAGKQPRVVPAGFDVDEADLNPRLFRWQRRAVQWALRVGRAALFADTGLGKTGMQLAFAEAVLRRHAATHPDGIALILAPLAVGVQTRREGEAMGLEVTAARTASDCRPGINVGNYERFLRGHYDAVIPRLLVIILDESQILANYTGETKRELIPAFRATPYRLVCSATPAPNEVVELCNQADFLGVMPQQEMLARFFTPKEAAGGGNGKYSLKAHARTAFLRWMAAWALSVRRPSDLGFEDTGYDLPPLDIHAHVVDTDWLPEGQLVFTKLKGVKHRAQVRTSTVAERVARVAELIRAEPEERWLVWYGLIKEVDALAKAVPDAVVVRGNDSDEHKEKALLDFAEGRTRVLLTHPKIAGLGMNFQAAARMAFIGIDDSYATYYQAIRRCWRFGQTRSVVAHIVLSEPQRAVYDNVLRKEREAAAWVDALVAATREQALGAAAARLHQSDPYEPTQPVRWPAWLRSRRAADVEAQARGGVTPRYDGLCIDQAHGKNWSFINGDSCELLAHVPDASIGLTLTSIPFQATYTYSPSERDLGNVRSPEEFWQHMSWVSRELLRVMMPGRLVCLHVQNLPRYANRDEAEESGRFDFRGATIAHFERAGFVYHSETTVWKDPQVQFHRNHSKGLLWSQLQRDSAWAWQAFMDYVVVMRKPGKNPEPVRFAEWGTLDEWVQLASGVWADIRQTATLDGNEGNAIKGPGDEKHLCPLQMPLIERCIRLWSNPGDEVLDPFGGIASTPVGAIRLGRRGLTFELKPEYWRQGVAYLEAEDFRLSQPTLFDAGLDLPAPAAPEGVLAT
jgi:DNA modification methylase